MTEHRYETTRNGRRVRILCDDGPRKGYPIIGVRDDGVVSSWTAAGHFVNEDEHPLDLMPAPKTRDVWVVWRRGENVGEWVAALECASVKVPPEVKTLAVRKITLTEGEGLSATDDAK